MNHKWKAVGLIFLLFLSVLFPADGMKVGDNRRAEPEQISTQAASERPAEELNTEVSTEVSKNGIDKTINKKNLKRIYEKC